MVKRIRILITVALAVVITWWLLLRDVSVDEREVHSHSIAESGVRSRELSAGLVEDASFAGKISESVGHPPTLEEATDPIFALIPDWLRESGEVRREHVQVAGHLVTRVRSRYAWNGGELVEVEVTDLGEGPTEDLLKSLGFDLELEAEETNASFRAVHDEADYVSNLEYDAEDASGHVQYFVAGRYLMEVQIEGLSFEVFQAMEDRDRLIGRLLETVGQSN